MQGIDEAKPASLQIASKVPPADLLEALQRFDSSFASVFLHDEPSLVVSRNGDNFEIEFLMLHVVSGSNARMNGVAGLPGLGPQRLKCGEFVLADPKVSVIDCNPSSSAGNKSASDAPQSQPHRTEIHRSYLISGIVHLLRNGGRWQNCPVCYRPSTTVYNRYHRWSGRGVWQRMLAAVVEATPGGLHLIDSTTANAHRDSGGKRGCG